MERLPNRRRLSTASIVGEVMQYGNFIVFQRDGGGFIPILLFVLLLCAALVPYIIAITKDGANPLLPFISDAAGSPPQSGIFAILLAYSAFVGAIGLFVKYLMVANLNAQRARKIDIVNTASAFFGAGALFGMLMVGAYPINTLRGYPQWAWGVAVPHFVAAIILFGSATIFWILDCALLRMIWPEKKCLLVARLVLLILGVVPLVSLPVLMNKAMNFKVMFGGIREQSFQEVVTSKNTCEPWKFPAEYSDYYIFCAACEWFLFITYILQFLTLVSDAKLYSVQIIVGKTGLMPNVRECSRQMSIPGPSIDK